MHNVLVIIPTVDGREEHLHRCTEAYYGNDILVLRGFSTCGEAWNVGADHATKCGHKYVHMTADDLVPHKGWVDAAVETLEQNCGYLPGALIYRPDGTLESFGNQMAEDWSVVEGASVPFCKTENWVPIPNIHYWSDNAFDYAQKHVHDYRFLLRHNYAFTHYTASAGRKTMDDRERMIYEEWKETL